MRGERSIFQTLFSDNTPQTAQLPLPERKGRSEALKLRQNEMIICRYYYYIKIQGRQYDKALELLQDEVFLSVRTIIDIINRDRGQLKTLQQLKPDLKYFRTKYPFLNWQPLFQ